MAEAEDVLQDVARHATIYVRGLWARHRKPDGRPPDPALDDCAERLDLLLTAACGQSFPLRIAQPPAPPTLLARLFRRHEGPPPREAVPATDGCSIWLPARLPGLDARSGHARYRVMALQQALRARRDSPRLAMLEADPLVRDLFLLGEALAADGELAAGYPGLVPALAALRRDCLDQRPSPGNLPDHLRILEEHLQAQLATRPADARRRPLESMDQAHELAGRLRKTAGREDFGPRPLFKDCWTGEFRAPGRVEEIEGAAAIPPAAPQRSARLPRSPRVREASEDEDDDQPGAWMIQPGEPVEQAEDPAGLQRPVDRDQETAADELADMLSELPEARLVTAPGRPAEVLLSDDPPDPRSRLRPQDVRKPEDNTRQYPEWDWRSQDYDPQGATVHLLPALPGPEAWVDATLEQHRGMLDEIRRRFEMLRAQRTRLHRRPDGDEVDIDALVAARGEFAAGLPLSQNVYLEQRRARRDMAVLLLIDVSGSTDGWISGMRRVIDVEREALLLVCVALEGLGHPYAVQAFSGEGPHGVIVRDVKTWREPFGREVALRIAGLEPESYTRAGAALRHASNVLMAEGAEHRLLLMLSDGKPNDVDHYEGRYGVEDLRQAVTEARLQGISPFCLTIDRQGAAYLPQVFGPGHYALLPRPDLLPRVLLDWLRRLVGS